MQSVIKIGILASIRCVIVQSEGLLTFLDEDSLEGDTIGGAKVHYLGILLICIGENVRGALASTLKTKRLGFSLRAEQDIISWK